MNNIELLHSVEKNFSFTHYTLEYDKQFSFNSRDQFNKAIDQIINMLANKHLLSCETIKNDWYLSIYTLRSLGKIKHKLIKIQKEIPVVTGKNFFIKKINTIALPLLSSEFDSLKKEIYSNYRLPFNADQAWFNYYQAMTKKVIVEEATTPSYIESELFHWLGERFDPEKVKKTIPVKDLEGNLGVRALYSYKCLLNELIKTAKDDRLIILQSLMQNIVAAEMIALKIDFAHQAKSNGEGLNDQTYFDKLTSYGRPKTLSEQNKQLEEVNRLFTVSTSNPVPIRVLSNNLCHDILSLINLSFEFI